MALQYARGEIFAFIDDDAYPREDWLKNAIHYFDDPEVGAVGGPAVTAPGDNVWQQASGKVYESFLCSGGYTYRYIPQAEREVDDLPSVNLIVRKDIFELIGGYDSNYYPGEDTKLCLDIVQKAGKKDPIFTGYSGVPSSTFYVCGTFKTGDRLCETQGLFCKSAA